MVVEAAFDRKIQDVGNILMMEHVNVLVPNQQLAQIFYISGLGLTRDPYMMVGQDNMWANAGKQQFHLPTRGMQVVRGVIGIEVPDIEALKSRLEAVKPLLADTKFECSVDGDEVLATCPWGNKFRCKEGVAVGNELPVGIPYVEFNVPTGAAEGIARFYSEMIGAPAARRGRRRSRRARAHGAEAGAPFPGDRRRASALRRPSHCRLPLQLLRPPRLPEGARARHGGEQRLPVPL